MSTSSPQGNSSASAQCIMMMIISSIAVSSDFLTSILQLRESFGMIFVNFSSRRFLGASHRKVRSQSSDKNIRGILMVLL